MNCHRYIRMYTFEALALLSVCNMLVSHLPHSFHLLDARAINVQIQVEFSSIIEIYEHDINLDENLSIIDS